MEVHHHPELPHGETKKFKEYFLEFLMIFLAVTMGFIAENVREHLSESSKEKEYIVSMIKNLADDTANLKVIIRQTRQQRDGIDSVRKVPKDKLGELVVQDSLYLLTNRYLFYANDFKNNDITLTQLRNAGGARLIRNEGIIDSIAIHESRISDLNLQFNALFASFVRTREHAILLFDLNISHQFTLHPTSTPVLITNDKEKINSFYNECWIVLVGLDGYGHMLKEHLEYTTRLMAYLKNAYDVE